MYKYKPLLDQRAAGNGIRQYLKDHHSTFLAVLKPLLPYFIALQLLDIALVFVFPPTADGEYIALGGFVSAYFLAAFVISWHRVVIHGPDSFTSMNPLKPTKNELLFMGTFIGLWAGLIILGILTGGLATLIHPIMVAIVALFFIPGAIYFGMRLSFYFPARATNSPVTLKQAFHMSHGYIWKLMMAGFYASWRLTLAIMGASIIVAIVAGLLSTVLMFVLGGAFDNGKVFTIVTLVLSLPITLYLNPLATMLGVTVLSNYYQHYLQKGAAADHDPS